MFLITKKTGPVVRESRQAFNKRYAGTIYGLDNSGGVGLIEATLHALYNYDTSDCYVDPVTCMCRNLNMAQYCYINTDGQVVFGASSRKRDGSPGNMTGADLTAMLTQEVFLGTTVCDHAINFVSGRDWEDNVTMIEKHRVVACFDKHIQGLFCSV